MVFKIIGLNQGLYERLIVYIILTIELEGVKTHQHKSKSKITQHYNIIKFIPLSRMLQVLL